MTPPVAVVVDTNVWTSGLLVRTGAPALLTRRMLQHARPVFTVVTFEELRTRLWRPKFDRYLSIERRRAFLTDLDAVALWVDVPPDIGAQRECRDPDDDALLHAALAADASWLVSGDADLLVLAESFASRNLNIVTPAAAMTASGFP